MRKYRRVVLAALTTVALLVSPSFGGLMSPATAATSLFGNAYLTLSSFSGTTLAPIGVSGGGFEPGSTVAVYTGSGAAPAGAPTGLVGIDGNFGPVNVSLPLNAPQGAVPITVTGLTGSTAGTSATNSYYVVPLTGAITVEASAHTPGTATIVSGTGFAPNETVTLQLGTASTTAVADALGAFAGASIVIPRDKPGSYKLTALGAASGATAVDYFYIDAFYPSVYPSAYYVMPGQPLSFSGQGYLPGEAVDVTTAAGSVVASFLVPANGSFETVGSFNAPLAWAGTSQTLTLKGRDSGGLSTVTFTIGQFFANVVPTDYYALPGKVVGFSGYGFAPGELVDAYIGKATTPSGLFLTDDDGAFVSEGGFSVPFNTDGSVAFRFVGRDSAASSTAQISVGKLFAQISPADYYVKPGTITSVAASGFASGETVTLTAPGIPDQTAIVDVDGNAELGPFAFPYGATESLTYTAVGSLSKATAAVTVGVASFNPTASPSTYYATPGTPLTLTGSDFAPGETVNVLQGKTVVATAIADEFGAVTVPAFPIPFGTNGALTYELRGEKSLGVAPVSITAAAFSPQVSPSTFYDTPGAPVSFTGSGFAPGETITVVQGRTAIASVPATALGEFELTGLTLPFSGTASYSFIGKDSMASVGVSVGLAAFQAGVGLTSYYGPGGTALTLTGSGFAPSESVAVSFGGVSLGTVVATAKGGFELPYTVPFGPSGDKAVVATGALSGATVKTTFTQAQVYTAIGLDAYAVAPGEPVGFNGSGFYPGEAIEVRVGSAVVATFAAGTTGALAGSYVLPLTQTPGPLTFTVTGTQSFATKELTLYVTGG